MRNAPLLSFCLKTRAGSAITSQEKDDPMETTMETAMERAKEAPEKQEVHLSRRLETPLRLDYRIPKAHWKDSNQVSGARLESQVQGRSLNPALFLFCFSLCVGFVFSPCDGCIACVFFRALMNRRTRINFPVFLVPEVAENAGDSTLDSSGFTNSPPRMYRRSRLEIKFLERNGRRVIFECFSGSSLDL